MCTIYCEDGAKEVNFDTVPYIIRYTIYRYKIYTVCFKNTMQKYRGINAFSKAFINLNFTFELLNSKAIELCL